MDVDEESEESEVEENPGFLSENYSDIFKEREASGHWNTERKENGPLGWTYLGLDTPIEGISATFSDKVENSQSPEREYLDKYITSDDVFQKDGKEVTSVLMKMRRCFKDIGIIKERTSRVSFRNCQACVALTLYVFLINPGTNYTQKTGLSQTGEEIWSDKKRTAYEKAFDNLPSTGRVVNKATGFAYCGMNFIVCNSEGYVKEFLDPNIPEKYRLSKDHIFQINDNISQNSKNETLRAGRRAMGDPSLQFENLIQILEWEMPMEKIDGKNKLRISTDADELGKSLCDFLDSNRVSSALSTHRNVRLHAAQNTHMHRFF